MKGKRYRVALKLNVEKACDSVERAFLFGALNASRFHPKMG